MKKLFALFLTMAMILSMFITANASEFNLKATENFAALLDKNDVYYVVLDSTEAEEATEDATGDGLAVMLDDEDVIMLVAFIHDEDDTICVISATTQDYKITDDNALSIFILANTLNDSAADPFKYTVVLDDEAENCNIRVSQTLFLDENVDVSEMIYNTMLQLPKCEYVADLMLFMTNY